MNGWWIDAALLVALAVLLVLSFVFSRTGARRLRVHDRKEGRSRRETPAWARDPHGVLLRQAGIMGRGGRPALWAWKVFFAAVLPLVRAEFLLWFGVEPLYDQTSVYVAVIGFFLPELWLLRRRKRRRKRIEAALSYFLDLTVALLRAGLPIEQALRRAGTHGFRGRHPLGVEIDLVAHEMAMGKDRGEAIGALPERTGVADFRSVAGAVRMGLKRGSSIEEALGAQADTMRVKLRERRMRRINRMAVVALFPVLLCGLPVFLVVVYFPAFLRIVETLNMLRESYY